MVKLRKDDRGNYIARKRLPDDVREEYGAQYGAHHEAKFFAPASDGFVPAKGKFHDWEAEVTTRIETIRALRRGQGITLTTRQARALAGEWYNWFVSRHPESDAKRWSDVRDTVHEAMREAAGDDVWERSDPDELWRDDLDFRKAVSPVLADVGETAQFLATKRLVLNADTQSNFLHWLYDDLSAALRRLQRVATGDYSADKYAERFPNFEGSDAGDTPQQLFGKWVEAKKPAYGTIESWRYVFIAMAAYFPNRSVASTTPDEAQTWITGLVTKKRSAATVSRTHIKACRTVFGWAVEYKHLTKNPFAEVKVTVPRATQHRETKAFRPSERHTILKAALGTKPDTPFNAAKRWVPWLCAYTGARPSEITQLRSADVVKEDGIDALRITPDAGPVKNRKARIVPLHEHLVEQGFLEFVAQHGVGPLFYKPRKRVTDGERKKPPASQVRQRLANWVRALGVTDTEVSPNHGWRHTFKQRADRAAITERMSDYITGHSSKTTGASYGAPTLEDMAEALKKFPRYETEDHTRTNSLPPSAV